MKKLLMILAAMGVMLSGCGGSAEPVEYDAMGLPETTAAAIQPESVTGETAPQWEDAVRIALDGSRFESEAPGGGSLGVCVTDVEISTDGGEPVFQKTVLTVDTPGTYVLSGSSEAAQVVVDLGDGAANDPTAVVTLVLDGLDIACADGPAILFRNVYECSDPELTGEHADTSAAGANLYIASGSENTVTCPYGGQSEYETAVWSEMSVNIGGEGSLFIDSGAEGLGSALHLTVNGGDIQIRSGNDGINADYDGASVITVNGGRLNITVDGRTGEGDGIDSNGWLVINGGTVVAAACESSDDSGLDADQGIYLNGGTVIATGNMLDRISGGARNYAVFQFEEKQPGGSTYTLNNAEDKPVLSTTPVNGFTCLILGGEGLAAGDYSLWRGQTRMQGAPGQAMYSGMQAPGAGEMPEGGEPPEMPGQQPPPEMPEGDTPPEMPGDMMPPEGAEPVPGETFPEGMEPLQGEMAFPERVEPLPQPAAQPSQVFTVKEGGNYFSYVAEAEG